MRSTYPGDGRDRLRLGPISTYNLTLEIHKFLHRNIDMVACPPFQHITQQRPDLVRDITWAIERTKEAFKLVRSNYIEKDICVTSKAHPPYLLRSDVMLRKVLMYSAE